MFLYEALFLKYLITLLKHFLKAYNFDSLLTDWCKLPSQFYRKFFKCAYIQLKVLSLSAPAGANSSLR